MSFTLVGSQLIRQSIACVWSVSDKIWLTSDSSFLCVITSLGAKSVNNMM